MEITVNITVDTEKRQQNLKNLRLEARKRFPKFKSEEVLIQLLQPRPDPHMVYLFEDLIGYVFLKDKIRFEIDQEQPLSLHIESHEEFLVFSSSFQSKMKELFLLAIGG